MHLTNCICVCVDLNYYCLAHSTQKATADHQSKPVVSSGSLSLIYFSLLIYTVQLLPFSPSYFFIKSLYAIVICSIRMNVITVCGPSLA